MTPSRANTTLSIPQLLRISPPLDPNCSPKRSATQHLFDGMPKRDTFSPLHVFQRLRRGGVPLRPHAFPPVLAACPSFPFLGLQIHAVMVKFASPSHPVLATALLDMYSKCGRLADALLSFDEMPVRDAVAWGALVACFVRHGLVDNAFAAFHAMAEDGVAFTGHTLCALLKACATSRALRRGKEIHARVVVTGDDSLIMGTALVDFYSSCGMVRLAMAVFDRLKCRKDVGIYNALVSGCVQNRHYKEAFLMLGKMRPNGITLTSALSACSESLNLSYGKQIHCAMIRYGYDSDPILCNSLLDMYAKCGNTKAARMVFDQICEKDVVSWTSMIDAYAIQGNGIEGLKLLKMMEDKKCDNVSPNAITFLAVLSACGHSGLVDAGWDCFLLMSDKYGLDPGPEHYACFIDLLGRAGRIDEAWELYCGVSPKTDTLTPAVCLAMLNACRINMDLARGEHVAKHLLELDPDNPGSYVLVSNFYVAVGMWEEAEDLRKLIQGRGLRKEVGSSQIALEGCI